MASLKKKSWKSVSNQEFTNETELFLKPWKVQVWSGLSGSKEPVSQRLGWWRYLSSVYVYWRSWQWRKDNLILEMVCDTDNGDGERENNRYREIEHSKCWSTGVNGRRLFSFWNSISRNPLSMMKVLQRKLPHISISWASAISIILSLNSLDS
jgi:hypothetical protein